MQLDNSRLLRQSSPQCLQANCLTNEVKQVKAISREPSTYRERKDLGRLIEQMTAPQRQELLRRCCEHAVSFGKVYKTDFDCSTNAIYNDLVCLTVMYGVSWETINLEAEAVRRGKRRHH